MPFEQVLLGHAQILEELGDTDDADRIREDAFATLCLRADRLPEKDRERFWTPPSRAALRASQEEH